MSRAWGVLGVAFSASGTEMGIRILFHGDRRAICGFWPTLVVGD
jgi:hypothetical protein